MTGNKPQQNSNFKKIHGADENNAGPVYIAFTRRRC